jgi:hypothetical protein
MPWGVQLCLLYPQQYDTLAKSWGIDMQSCDVQGCLRQPGHKLNTLRFVNVGCTQVCSL